MKRSMRRCAALLLALALCLASGAAGDPDAVRGKTPWAERK